MISPAPGQAPITPQLLPFPRWLILGLLFAAALGIRLYHLSDPPLGFHATRQYRSLIIARAFYFDHLASVPDWQKGVARCSQRNQGTLEPPIMELVVSSGYRLLGGERVWLPRVLNSVIWLTGGVFLLLIGRRVVGEEAAIFGTAFYLFLPFAVVASRSFQPDPLMVALMLASVWALLRHDETPSRTRLAGAAVLSSLAFLVKPHSIFALLAVFLALGIQRRGLRAALWNRDLALFGAIAVLPTLLVYGYDVASGAFPVHEATKTVLPQLWVSPYFWRGWLSQIESTVGFVCFVSGLLGTFMLARGVPTALMRGLWAGYVAFALVLNYNLATHDYYQLQLVPIVGLSLAPIVALVMRRLYELQPSHLARLAAWSVWCLALVLSLAGARARILSGVDPRKVAIQREIGEGVRHSASTIFLSGDYGVPLEYNGLLCGTSWPIGWDMEWERLAGDPPLDPEERFRRWYAEDAPEYFIVEDFRELAAQPDLVQFLSRFPVVAQSSDYAIYRLTGAPR